ncbi:MAG: hypothetical protein ACRC92_21550 [Peptostreptococcaceae bacterium]
MMGNNDNNNNSDDEKIFDITVWDMLEFFKSFSNYQSEITLGHREYARQCVTKILCRMSLDVMARQQDSFKGKIIGDIKRMTLEDELLLTCLNIELSKQGALIRQVYGEQPLQLSTVVS